MTITEIRAEIVDIDEVADTFVADEEFKVWLALRCEMFLEDGASKAFLQGFTRCALGNAADHERYVGDPFGACDYLDGYQQAEYALGPVDVVRGAAPRVAA